MIFREKSVKVIDDSGVKDKTDWVGLFFKILSSIIILVMIVLNALAFAS